MASPDFPWGDPPTSLPTYNDVVLLDKQFNRINSIQMDYYTVATDAWWCGYIYNNTGADVVDCFVSTDDTYVGIIAISGGGVTGYQTVTSGFVCGLGTIVSGGMAQMIMRVHIEMSDGITGCQAVPLYITK